MRPASHPERVRRARTLPSSRGATCSGGAWKNERAGILPGSRVISDSAPLGLGFNGGKTSEHDFFNAFGADAMMVLNRKRVIASLKSEMRSRPRLLDVSVHL